MSVPIAAAIVGMQPRLAAQRTNNKKYVVGKLPTKPTPDTNDCGQSQ
jgi:hypothetical protein